MSEKDINRWHDTIAPREKAPQPWTIKSGGSWDMLDIQPIPDAMLAELMQVYHRIGTPWNCRSLPLSPTDREHMFLLHYSMQGLVSRMRRSDEIAAHLLDALEYALPYLEACVPNPRNGVNHDNTVDVNCVDRARAAIAKATAA